MWASNAMIHLDMPKFGLNESHQIQQMGGFHETKIQTGYYNYIKLTNSQIHQDNYPAGLENKKQAIFNKTEKDLNDYLFAISYVKSLNKPSDYGNFSAKSET